MTCEGAEGVGEVLVLLLCGFGFLFCFFLFLVFRFIVCFLLFILLFVLLLRRNNIRLQYIFKDEDNPRHGLPTQRPRRTRQIKPQPNRVLQLRYRQLIILQHPLHILPNLQTALIHQLLLLPHNPMIQRILLIHMPKHQHIRSTIVRSKTNHIRFEQIDDGRINFVLGELGE